MAWYTGDRPQESPRTKPNDDAQRISRRLQLLPSDIRATLRDESLSLVVL